jgi:hypothetical protein
MYNMAIITDLIPKKSYPVPTPVQDKIQFKFMLTKNALIRRADL